MITSYPTYVPSPEPTTHPPRTHRFIYARTEACINVIQQKHVKIRGYGLRGGANTSPRVAQLIPQEVNRPWDHIKMRHIQSSNLNPYIKFQIFDIILSYNNVSSRRKFSNTVLVAHRTYSSTVPRRESGRFHCGSRRSLSCQIFYGKCDTDLNYWPENQLPQLQQC